jgi:hypothetical protein
MREIDGRAMAADPDLTIFQAVLDGRAEMVVGVEDITPDEEDGT